MGRLAEGAAVAFFLAKLGLWEIDGPIKRKKFGHLSVQLVLIVI